VAWAASFFGAAFGAWLGRFVGRATVGLGLTVFFALAAAVGATLWWMRLLRRSPRLRAALDVTEEGVPVTVTELDDEGKAP
jgi:hypothetical protein